MADSSIIITSSIASMRANNPEGLRPDSASAGQGDAEVQSRVEESLEISQLMLEEVKQINVNFETFFEKLELNRLRSKDSGTPSAGPSQPTPKKDKEEDDGFLFDGIIMGFAAFKDRIIQFAARFKNFIKIIAKPFVIITAAVSGILGFIEGFTENENDTIGEKITRGIMRGIENILDLIVAWPAQLLVDAAAWLMRALGAESIADYLDKVDIRKALADLFDYFETFIEPIGAMIDSVIAVFQSEQVQGIITAVKDKIIDGFNANMEILSSVMNAIFRAVQWFGETDMDEKIEAGLGLFNNVISGIQNWISNLATSLYEALDFAKSSISFAQGVGDTVGNFFSGDNDGVVSSPGTMSRETSSANLSEESRTAAAQNIMGQQTSVNVVDNSVKSTNNSSSSAAIMMESPAATNPYDLRNGRNGVAFG